MSTFLTQNFTVEQLTKSDTAIRLGINNTPSAQIIENMRALCVNILDKVRDNYKMTGSVVVHSGYRCLALNRAVGSKDTSDHVIGCAADIEVIGVDNPTLAKWVAEHCDFNQVILEFYEPEEGPNSGWVHVAYHPAGLAANKKQRLIINRHGTSTF